MQKEELLKHKFQFFSFCPVFHDQKRGKGGINVNDDSHLMHITQGTGTVWINGQRFELASGTVISVPPFVEFRFDINVPFEMLNIHYRVWLSNGDPLEEHVMLPLVFRPEYFSATEERLRQMVAVLRKGLPESLQLSSMAHEVVIQHLGSIELMPRLSKALDERIRKSYLHLLSSACRQYDSKETAALCNLSVSQMNRVFRRCFKHSPQRFWEKRRFTNVCLELRNADKTIAQVAADCGFDDNAYFSRWFKKMGGCSPSEYRKQQTDLTFSL